MIGTARSLAVLSMTALACLGLQTAAAEERIAPYLDTARFPDSAMLFHDVSGKGTMVTIVPRDLSGKALRHRGKIVTVRRAVPPGETLTVPVGDFVGPAFRGSCAIATTRPIAGGVRAGALHYEFARPSRDRTQTAAVPEGEHSVVVHNPDSEDQKVRVRAQSAGERGVIREGRLPAFGTWILPLPLRIAARLHVESESRAVVLVLSGPPAGIRSALGYAGRR